MADADSLLTDAVPKTIRPRIGTRIAVVASILLIGLIAVEFALWPFVSRDIVGPSAARHDAYYGKALKPGYSGTICSHGYRFHLDTNSLGYRGPEPQQPPRGCVVFLGDSATFGDTVDSENVFVEIIGRRLADRYGEGVIPVVNTAMGGNGQGRWLRFLQRDAAAFDPRLIVMQVCRNDFQDNHLEGLYDLEDDGSLRELTPAPQSTFRAVQERIESIPLLPYSRIYCVLKQTVKRALTSEGRAAEELERLSPRSRTTYGPDDDITYRITEECLMICRDRGWPVIALSAQLPQGERRDRFIELFKRYGHEFIIIPTIGERPDLHNPARDDHWNADGHRFVADLVFERVIAAPTLQALDTHAATAITPP